MDFNSDGKLDAILGSGEVALGNGDGTFALSTPLFAHPDRATPLNYPLLQMPIYANSSIVVGLSESDQWCECGVHAAEQQRRECEFCVERGDAHAHGTVFG